MENKSNNNISQESDDTEDIDLLLNDFRTALIKEYIIPIINKMIYIIQNNVTSEIVDELKIFHIHSIIKVSKMHDQFEYLKVLQQNIYPYVSLFNKSIYKEINLFCLNQIVKIGNQN